MPTGVKRLSDSGRVVEGNPAGARFQLAPGTGDSDNREDARPGILSGGGVFRSRPSADVQIGDAHPDQEGHIVYNSRVFCTRWNGLQKGSILDDALDDKEFEGNLIYLLQNGSDFIRNNSKVRFAKKAQYRVDKPDYADRAVTEALVNALIHRDYIVRGSEIHIDMYDDRLEIQSPGGMFEGKPIQECSIDIVGSVRRNPVIADLFHRMKFMERRGSGLRKIVSETEKIPGYTEEMQPEFHSTATNFRVVLKNVNYNLPGGDQDTMQDTTQVTTQDEKAASLIAFCDVERTRGEMMAYLGLENREHFRKAYLKPVLNAGKTKMTIPDKPNSKNQKYIKA